MIKGFDAPADELGAGKLVTQASVSDALSIPKDGIIYDLDAGRFRGQARHYAHPPFELVTYRTPQGERNQADLDYLRPDVNEVGYGFISELLIGTMHSGAHIDSLAHVTCGDDQTWYGGQSAKEHLGDFGPQKSDASKIPPLLARGVILDIAGLKGVDILPESYPITVEDLEAAANRQAVEIRKGDVVLIRTGQMRNWPYDVRSADREAGITLESAKWLSAKEPLAVGSDLSAVEVAPSGVKGSTQPVHIHMLIEKGIYLLEWIYLEDLATAERSEFLFIALPLKIAGATGSMLRPVAVL